MALSFPFSGSGSANVKDVVIPGSNVINAGDTRLVWATLSSGQVITDSPGFTKIHEDQVGTAGTTRRLCIYKQDSAPEDPGDITFVTDLSGRYGFGQTAIRSDVAGATIVIDVAPIQNDADSGTTRTIPGVDPTVTVSEWLAYIGELNIQSNNTPPLPSGMTSLAAQATTNGGHGLRLARQSLTTGDAQSDKTVSGPNDRWAAVSLVVAEQAPAGNPGAWLPFFP